VRIIGYEKQKQATHCPVLSEHVHQQLHAVLTLPVSRLTGERMYRKDSVLGAKSQDLDVKQCPATMGLYCGLFWLLGVGCGGG